MKFILKGFTKWIILGVTLIISIVSIFLMLDVEINYDLSYYLPSDSKTKEALDILRDEFGLNSVVEVMVTDLSLSEALIIKNKIKTLDNVAYVIWLDDLVDINVPLSSLDQNTVNSYYKDNKALYTVMFNSGDYDLETEEGINNIRNDPKDSKYLFKR